VAIIPMVGMFDVGIKAATQGSNYDKAQAFADQQLRQAILTGVSGITQPSLCRNAD
jgi:hypothetical protein